MAEKSQEYFDLTAIEKQATLDKAQALLQLNGTLPDEIAGFLNKNTSKFQRPYVFYEKVLNHLYLSKIIEGTFVYTEKEQAIVKKIAMMCPLIAGEAPMKARTLYKHFIHPEALPEANCENVPKRIPKIRIPTTYKVYPNPTTGLLSIASNNGMGSFDWKLCTVTGSLLKTGHADNAMETIDMNDLSNGIYLLQVTEAGQQPALLKIVIMK
jgi:hypothetical protein